MRHAVLLLFAVCGPGEAAGAINSTVLHLGLLKDSSDESYASQRIQVGTAATVCGGGVACLCCWVWMLLEAQNPTQAGTREPAALPACLRLCMVVYGCRAGRLWRRDLLQP